jgi:hypothetical protein
MQQTIKKGLNLQKLQTLNIDGRRYWIWISDFYRVNLFKQFLRFFTLILGIMVAKW